MANQDRQGRKQDPARSHVLYGVLEYIATTVAAQDAKLNKLEQQVTTCQGLQNELKGLMLEITKSSFSLKEKGYEDRLRRGVATLFADSLFREVSDSTLEKLVKAVLKNEVTAKEYKVALGIRKAKEKLSMFRSEEKRRVLGISPCQKYAKMTTEALCDPMLKFTKAQISDDVKNNYTKHLVLLRKFVRDSTVQKGEVFYKAFKDWLVKTYPPSGCPLDEVFCQLVNADKSYNYGSVHDTASPPDQATVNIDTDEGNQSDDNMDFGNF